MANTGELLTPSEAARELRVSPWTLQNWRSEGGKYLPFLKIGGRVRYRRRDVERLLSGRNVSILTGDRAAA